MQKLKTAVVACLIALTLATNNFSFAEVIGDPAQLASILIKMAPHLDKLGIDVGNAQAPGERPRVGLMSHFNFDISFKKLVMTSAVETAVWMDQFSQGMFGRIEFLSEPASTAATEFRKAWDQAPPDQRVFISFAGADNEHANKIEEALKSNGYVPFKYLNEKGGPKYSPAFTGEMFSKAGLHLVLDTPAARKSLGVLMEKKASEKSTLELSRELQEFLREQSRRSGLKIDKPGRPSWQKPAAEDLAERLREAIKKGKTETDPARRTGGDEKLREPRRSVK